MQPTDLITAPIRQKNLFGKTRFGDWWHQVPIRNIEVLEVWFHVTISPMYGHW
ncbi:predicted protein [Sclerotinia sclerotiorum 1980 UF-70]|uniref:Uncharacterized protein n=1 Tax=Sclerotinia sclerotiorum (strain ATCC 18683 / 1980 / Ss-1) TaxID=665079 RepID=A7F5D7_SCLS1|nr:predicted protein [Sclerotinia sclerotiorum 1980 UF-70]EDN97958.1 predicted protein [Sclerotinia sclerotiorum 1980 UF-70]